MHARALPGTGVHRQEVSHTAQMPGMPTAPVSVTFGGIRRKSQKTETERGVARTSQRGGPCSRPGSSAGLPHRLVAVQKPKTLLCTHHWPGNPCPE